MESPATLASLGLREQMARMPNRSALKYSERRQEHCELLTAVPTESPVGSVLPDNAAVTAGRAARQAALFFPALACPAMAGLEEMVAEAGMAVAAVVRETVALCTLRSHDQMKSRSSWTPHLASQEVEVRGAKAVRPECQGPAAQARLYATEASGATLAIRVKTALTVSRVRWEQQVIS
jgi:hypothetical protein